MINENIHSFWLEGELSKINLLTIRSYQDKGHKFIIHTFDDKLTTECELRDASDILPRKEWRYYTALHPNMKLGLIGDTLRARLLNKYGEVHTDLDVTCLKPIDFKEDYVFRKHHRGVVMNFVKVPKECSFTHFYMNYTNCIDVNKNDWEGSFSGLIDGVRGLKLEEFIRKPEELGMDDHIWWKHLLENNEPPKSEYIIHWCHSTRFDLEYKKDSFYHNLLKQYNLV